MNNEMIFTAREQRLDLVLNQVALAINRPLRRLTSYYSKTLERELNVRQTLLLINAQLAFVMTVFPVDCHFLLRVLCACWLVKALHDCRKCL